MKTKLYIFRSENYNILITSQDRKNLYYYADEVTIVFSIKELMQFLKYYNQQYRNKNIIRVIYSEVIKKPINKYTELDAISDWNYFFHSYKQMQLNF
jgi:hypothetical protein